MELTCAFTGHRPAHFPFGDDERHPDCVRLKEALAEQIAQLAKASVRHFITGVAQGVDIWAAEAVLALRETDKALTLTCALPCADQAQYWPQDQQARHAAIVERCDRSVTLFPAYTDGCMIMRNRWMVEHADLVLAVYDGSPRGGTAFTVRYAVSQEKQVVLLEPGTLTVARI